MGLSRLKNLGKIQEILQELLLIFSKLHMHNN